MSTEAGEALEHPAERADKYIDERYRRPSRSG